jgi:hypothetical protein
MLRFRKLFGVPVVGIAVLTMSTPASADTFGDAAADDATNGGGGSYLSEVIGKLDLGASLRTGLWSHDAVPDPKGGATATGSVWLRMQPELSETSQLFAEGWVNGNRGLEEHSRDDVQGELREAWISYEQSPVNFRFGRQIVVWGRADRINPTDRISSRDYTLLFPEEDDLRRGNLMARSRIALSDTGTLELIWLPEFRPDVPRLPPPPAGVQSTDQHDRFALDQFAIRYDSAGGDVDWSVSYFRGLDRWPDLSLSGLPAAPSIDKRYHRIHSIGGDTATTVAGFGLRAEMAYVHTENQDGERPDIKRPNVFLVAGGDRDIMEGLNLNIQYVYRHIFSFRDPSSYPEGPIQDIAMGNATLSEQTDRNRHGFTTRLAYTGFHDLLKAELSALVYPAQGEAFLRAEVSYAITDTINASVGVNQFLGSKETYLGSLRESSAVYGQVRFGY